MSNKDKNTPNLKILIADDVLMNQLVIKQVISKYYNNFDIVSDGLQALNACKNNEFDIVFLDIDMPNMDGISALLEIKKIELYKSKPIIALTSGDSTDLFNDLTQKGFSDVLIKPFKLSEFDDIISRSLISNTSLEFNANGSKAVKLDLQVLTEYSNGDKDFEKEMIELFLNETPEIIKEMHLSFSSEDWESLKSNAHKLSPRFTLFGLSGLTKLVAKIESNCHLHENLNEIPLMLHQIDNTCFDTKPLLTKKLSEYD